MRSSKHKTQISLVKAEMNFVTIDYT